MDDLKKVSEQLKDNKTAEATRLADELYKELGVITDNVKLPEYVFVEYFLDFFRNGRQSENELLIYKWIELAGSPYREVDIVDLNGIVIYSVPALMVKPANNNELNQNVDFDNMLRTYNLKANVMHSIGEAYLQTELSKLDTPDATVEVSPDVKRWELIFARYDTPTIEEPVVSIKPIDDSMNIDYD